MTDRTPEDIEREGFIRQTLVALTANMAAANIHQGRRYEWSQIVHHAMEGTKECWKAIQDDRINSKFENALHETNEMHGEMLKKLADS